MKKFVFGLICGVCLAASMVVYAADTLQTYLMPAKFQFDGIAKELDDDNKIVLNYNGSAYVPVRFVAHNLGAFVRYDHDSQTISMDRTPISGRMAVDNEFFTYAAKGQLKGVEFGIGAKRSNVIAKWGDPHESGTFQSNYEAWFNHQYYFWDTGETAGSVRLVGNAINYEMDEIRTMLGPAKNDQQSEISSGWTLYYEAGSYQIFFDSDSEHGQVKSMLLKKK